MTAFGSAGLESASACSSGRLEMCGSLTAQLFQEPDDLCGFLLAYRVGKLQRELVTCSPANLAPRGVES